MDGNVKFHIYPLDLQYFAAEDEGRTELPTETKKKKAREEDGRVLKSQDIVSYIVTFGGIITIFAFKDNIKNHIFNMFNYSLKLEEVVSFDTINEHLIFYIKELLLAVAPILIITMVLGIIANLGQVGFFFSMKQIKPDIKKVSPNIVSFFKKIFGKKGMINFLKSLLLVIGILSVLFITLNNNILKMLQSSQQSIETTMLLFLTLIKSILIQAAIIILVVVVLDFFYQRWEYIDSLKMSKYDVKHEFYDQEGRPEVKQALDKKRQEIMKRKSIENVKEADVIITNPTHIAVALKYQAGIDMAPKCVAKGADSFAKKIKEEARNHDIYIYENKPLARELFKRVNIDDEIPRDLYEVVVEVLRIVYMDNQKKGKSNFSFG